MERLPPGQANQQLTRLWQHAGKSVLKLAILQEGAGLMDAKLMEHWRKGTLGEAITAIYTHYDAPFTAMTYQKRQTGLTIQRIHILDDAISSTGQAYLGLLIEYFRRINVPLGHESIYLLPRSECDERGITLPLTDIAIFDHRTVVETHYDETAIRYRDVYSASHAEDRAYVDETIDLADQLTAILTPAHQLQGVSRDERLTWVENHHREWLPGN